MFRYLIIFFFFSCSISSVQANDSLLTLKQQLDRLQREIKDISRVAYNHNTSNSNNHTSNIDLTALDIRIYDLEKDINKINENVEELIFTLDDLQKKFDDFDLQLIFLNKRLETLELQ